MYGRLIAEMNPVLPDFAPKASTPEGKPTGSCSPTNTKGSGCQHGSAADVSASPALPSPWDAPRVEAMAQQSTQHHVVEGPTVALETTPLLRTVGLCKTFKSRGLFSKGQGGVRALDHIHLVIMPGQIMGLVGESGSGKTTLGKAIMRLMKVDEGEVFFKGKNVLKMGTGAMKVFRHSTQMLFQNPSSTLHPKMTIGKMLQESLVIHRGLKGKGELRDAAESLLEKVSLSGRFNAYPDELSGGQKRRVGIARILAASPDMLVADEPTSGLDALLRAEIIDLLLQVKEPDQSYLLISHDLNVVQRACDLVAVMFHGRIVEMLPKSSITDTNHHPYTTELFNAAARLRGNTDKVQDLSTNETSIQATKGCAYLGRCKLAARNPGLAEHKCRKEIPQLVPIRPDQLVACHAFGGDAGCSPCTSTYAVEI